MREVEEIAEKVRQEPFAIMSPRGNCLARSFRFKKLCREAGIDAEVIAADILEETGGFIKITSIIYLSNFFLPGYTY